MIQNLITAWKDMFGKNDYHLEEYILPQKAPFVVVCPGGGFNLVCSHIEGRPYAKALNKAGYSAFVLRYRVREKAKYPAPMDDLAKAIAYILENADKLNVERDNYSIWGSSAGGYLAASFGTTKLGYEKYHLPKPGSLTLVYPVIHMGEGGHKGSCDNLLGKDAPEEIKKKFSMENLVDSDYPPTFLWNSKADKTVPYRNSVEMVRALEKAGVEHQYVQFETGEHGNGLALGTECETWFEQAVQFMEKCREKC